MVDCDVQEEGKVSLGRAPFGSTLEEIRDSVSNLSTQLRSKKRDVCENALRLFVSSFRSSNPNFSSGLNIVPGFLQLYLPFAHAILEALSKLWCFYSQKKIQIQGKLLWNATSFAGVFFGTQASITLLETIRKNKNEDWWSNENKKVLPYGMKESKKRQPAELSEEILTSSKNSFSPLAVQTIRNLYITASPFLRKETQRSIEKKAVNFFIQCPTHPEALLWIQTMLIYSRPFALEHLTAIQKNIEHAIRTCTNPNQKTTLLTTLSLLGLLLDPAHPAIQDLELCPSFSEESLMRPGRKETEKGPVERDEKLDSSPIDVHGRAKMFTLASSSLFSLSPSFLPLKQESERAPTGKTLMNGNKEDGHSDIPRMSVPLDQVNQREKIWEFAFPEKRKEEIRNSTSYFDGLSPTPPLTDSFSLDEDTEPTTESEFSYEVETSSLSDEQVES